MESVAARARVGKSTIYRLWPDKLALIGAAFRTLHEELGPDLDPGHGTARARLERMLGHVAEVVASSGLSRALPALVDAAERDAGLRAFHYGFQRAARQPLIEVLAEGVRSGELAAGLDPELAAFALLGAVYFCRLMTDAPLLPGRTGELVAAVLGRAAPDAPAATARAETGRDRSPSRDPAAGPPAGSPA
jgi:TetR/AcrR family transcriptional regulator of autoinduction and epiphytic fitness